MLKGGTGLVLFVEGGQVQGKVVLLGFRAQNRDQTHGTFKMVFNALLNGPADGSAETPPTQAARR